MTTIPSGSDIGIDDVPVRRVTAPRTNQPPIVVRYAGPVADIVQGPEQNTWGPREMVLADLYGMHRVCGDLHDLIAVERSGIRPADAKTSKPHHGSQRRRNGCLILRERQHRALMNVDSETQADHGFVSAGDYICAVYDSLDDKLIILADTRISARDLDRLCDPSFYRRGDKQEASVEWTNVPGLNAVEMHSRLDAADVYLRALGEDPDHYADDIQRVRERVADVQREQAEQEQEQDHRDRITETMAQ